MALLDWPMAAIPSSWTTSQVAAEQMLSAIAAVDAAMDQARRLTNVVGDRDSCADLVRARVEVLEADEIPEAVSAGRGRWAPASAGD